MCENIFHLTRAKKICKAVLACIIVPSMLLGIAGCGESSQSSKTPTQPKKEVKQIKVVSTLESWASLAREIGGNDVEVQSIISNPDTDMSTFKPSSKDLQKLYSAQVVVSNGAGYDSWVAKHTSKSSEIVNAASTVGALNGDNPYLWFSKDARNEMASSICNAFSKVLPSKKKVFAKRLDAVKSQENKLDEYLSNFAKSHKKFKYASINPVLFWLMSDMGISDSAPKAYAKQVAQGEEVDKANIDEFQKLIEERKFDVLISNSQRKGDDISILTGTAGRSYTSVMWVNELMPTYATDLRKWVMKICEDIDNASKTTTDMRKDLAKQEADQKKPITEKPTVSQPDPSRSNEGQQDPGKQARAQRAIDLFYLPTAHTAL